MASRAKTSKKKAGEPAGTSKKPVAKKRNYLFTYGVALFVMVVTWWSYMPSLENDFTNWDDDVYIHNNPLVTSPHISYTEIFRTPVSLNYHPLTILTLAWNYQSSQLDAKAYHRTNLMLHLINTLLVFIFIMLLSGQNLLVSALTALMFGIHPMHVESVAWVSERKDVLYVLFFMGGLICYLEYVRKSKITWYLLAFVLCIFSIFSKAMAVTFPMVLLLIDYYENRKWSSRLILEKTPFFIVALIAGIAAYLIQSKEAVGDFTALTIPQRISVAGYGAIMYIVKFFAPFNLSAFYPYPVLTSGLHLPMGYYFMPLIFLALLFAVWKWRIQRPLVFGAGFYIMSVFLVLQWISVGNVIMADRYTYLAYIGIAFLVAYYLDYFLFQRKALALNRNTATVILLVLISVLFAPLTYARCKVWKDSETLWTDVINKYPGKVEVAYRNRGTYYGKLGETDKAYADYMVLLKMHTTLSEIYSNLGNIYAMRNNVDSSMWSYSYAVKLDSTNTDAYVNRAVTNINLRKYLSAIQDLEHALKIRPQLDVARSMLGYAYLQNGEWNNSVNAYTLYLQKIPDDGKAYFCRSKAYEKLGNTEAATGDMNRAKALGYK